MTSMFFYGPNDRNDIDDFRPAVHDSDGLAVFNGTGESLWRPLSNPRDLQISTFQDLNPRGFGLMQRERNFFAYQDIESSFEKRPSLWMEPIGDWGEGGVMLFEIPTRRRSTTTSPRSGGLKARCRPRANKTTPIGCIAGPTARSRIRSPGSHEAG
jgi:glucan biosynthesis protein